MKISPIKEEIDHYEAKLQELCKTDEEREECRIMIENMRREQSVLDDFMNYLVLYERLTLDEALEEMKKNLIFKIVATLNDPDAQLLKIALPEDEFIEFYGEIVDTIAKTWLEKLEYPRKKQFIESYTNYTAEIVKPYVQYEKKIVEMQTKRHMGEIAGIMESIKNFRKVWEDIENIDKSEEDEEG